MGEGFESRFENRQTQVYKHMLTLWNIQEEKQKLQRLRRGNILCRCRERERREQGSGAQKIREGQEVGEVT